MSFRPTPEIFTDPQDLIAHISNLVRRSALPAIPQAFHHQDDAGGAGNSEPAESESSLSLLQPILVRIARGEPLSAMRITNAEQEIYKKIGTKIGARRGISTKEEAVVAALANDIITFEQVIEDYKLEELWTKLIPSEVNLLREILNDPPIYSNYRRLAKVLQTNKDTVLAILASIRGKLEVPNDMLAIVVAWKALDHVVMLDEDNT